MFGKTINQDYFISWGLKCTIVTFSIIELYLLTVLCGHHKKLNGLHISYNNSTAVVERFNNEGQERQQTPIADPGFTGRVGQLIDD